jgi:leucyl aminopeptidase
LDKNSFIDYVSAFSHGCYEFSRFKTNKNRKENIKNISFATQESLQENFDYAESLHANFGFCKDIANLPANIATPTFLSNEARDFSNKHSSKVDIEIIDESEFEKIGLNAMLFVSKGSEQSGKFIILKYSGADSSAPIHALVGKGVTFDTGGISLKPPAKMDEMKFDMCGAANVFSAFRTIVETGVKVNLVAAITCVENMPSSKAGKPGDIVTSLSGQTIEVLNTDAEGRLVLCDALTYVQNKYKPSTIVDVATLTGACIVALGTHIAAICANNDGFAQQIQKISNFCNDQVWQLPIDDTSVKTLESKFADMANIGNVPAGQTMVAAGFLQKFINTDCKWAHLDIAGVAWHDKQATGRPLRLLVEHIKSL